MKSTRRATAAVPARRDQQNEWGEWGPADRLEEDLTEPPSGYFRDMWGDSGADAFERMTSTQAPEWDFLAEHVVAEVMTRKVLALSPDSDVAEAALVRGAEVVLLTPERMPRGGEVAAELR